MINRKLEQEECPYFLNLEVKKLFGMERVFIQIILEELWKKPEIMYYIITKCDPDDINYNLSSFIIIFYLHHIWKIIYCIYYLCY